MGHGERTRRLKRTVNDRISEVLEEAGLVEGDFFVSVQWSAVRARFTSVLPSTARWTGTELG